mmetsp:Transcript_32898/g.70805  ORF Transcript_32898/g.70805 Transcript_32898/m.70805 type:complete len:466 (+) Transcript_32898:265-1662(+)
MVNGVTYQVIQNIGRGATCKVYKVQSESGEAFALKRIRIECQADVEALMEEIHLLKHLKDCDHVVKIIDSEVLPHRKFIHIVMELGEMDLGRLLSSRQFTLGDAQALWQQMLLSVQAIHQQRVIHGDLKPGNFLLVNGRLKLIDFGISKKISGETTNVYGEGGALGTISYIAPEVIRKSAGMPSVKTGRASDIWSLGIILYQVVYGQTPFHDLPPAHRIAAIANPELCIDCPQQHSLDGHSMVVQVQLADVLQRCLVTDATRRATLDELLKHPFLDNISRSVTRASFDVAFSKLLATFEVVAKRGLAEALGVDQSVLDDEEDIPDAQHFNWRMLGDEVWQQLERSEGFDQTDMEDQPLDTRGLEQSFQRWIEKGTKRKRSEAPQQSEPPQKQHVSQPSSAKQVVAGHRVAPKQPNPPRVPAGQKEYPPIDENIVIKRLKERRALMSSMPDDEASQEVTAFSLGGA